MKAERKRRKILKVLKNTKYMKNVCLVLDNGGNISVEKCRIDRPFFYRSGWVNPTRRRSLPWA